MEWLTTKGKIALVVREPGGTPIGESIRHLLQHAAVGYAMVPQTELLLFAASRAQLVRQVIVPALENGEIVISDRFLDSTTVYQGVARKLPRELVEQDQSICRGTKTSRCDLPSRHGSDGGAWEADPPRRFRAAIAWRNSLLRFIRPFVKDTLNSPPHTEIVSISWTQPNPKRKSPAKFGRFFVSMPFSREVAFEHLSASHRAGRLAHAYLLTGAGGSGKTWLAMELAGLVLERPAEGILAHPDVHSVQPESKSRRIVIGQMRELEHSIHRKPLLARSKVAIIHDADRMQPQAANAFLKTLEEPPARSLILLLSANPKGILETIRSRCLETPLLQTVEHPPSTEEGIILDALAEALLAETKPGVAEAFRFTRTLQNILAGAAGEDLLSAREHAPQGNFALQAGVR